MRCSSSEALLDAYVEGELDPRRRALVASHLATCEACTSLFEEFRVIDALLLKPRSLEPAANFTFKVMAEIRDMPRPHVHRVPTLAVLGTYVVFAWAILGAFFLFARGQALEAVAAVGAWFASANAAFASLAHATGHVFGRHSVDVTAAMGSVLAADAVAAGALFALYNIIRSRRLAAEQVEV
jgi:anti-sigma factor RsiW